MRTVTSTMNQFTLAIYCQCDSIRLPLVEQSRRRQNGLFESGRFVRRLRMKPRCLFARGALVRSSSDPPAVAMTVSDTRSGTFSSIPKAC